MTSPFRSMLTIESVILLSSLKKMAVQSTLLSLLAPAISWSPLDQEPFRFLTTLGGAAVVLNGDGGTGTG